MLLGWIPGPASKTIYYGHVTSLQLGPLLPLEIYELLMNARDMHEKVSSFQRTAIVNENNINSAQREEKLKRFMFVGGSDRCLFVFYADICRWLDFFPSVWLERKFFPKKPWSVFAKKFFINCEDIVFFSLHFLPRKFIIITRNKYYLVI